jgi:hypothetical protein
MIDDGPSGLISKTIHLTVRQLSQLSVNESYKNLREVRHGYMKIAINRLTLQWRRT